MSQINKNNALGQVLHAAILVNADMGDEMRVLDDYTFVYTLEGKAKYFGADGFTRDIVPGDLIIVFPDQPHNYNAADGSNWKQIYFAFDNPAFELWLERGFINPSAPIHHAEPISYWFKKFNSVLKSIEQASPSDAILSVINILKIQQILAEIFYAEKSDAIDAGDLAWSQRACELLNQSSRARQTIPQIADCLGMSYESFRKRFTRLAGCSPRQYSQQRVIEKARSLMLETMLSNKEIAYRLGFCDESHFSHRFKQITGRSPKEFRRSLPIRFTK